MPTVVYRITDLLAKIVADVPVPTSVVTTPCAVILRIAVSSAR